MATFIKNPAGMDLCTIKFFMVDNGKKTLFPEIETGIPILGASIG